MSVITEPAVAGKGRKKTTFRTVNSTSPNQHDPIASAWTMSPEGFVAKSHAVSENTMSTMASGSVVADICKRYARNVSPIHVHAKGYLKLKISNKGRQIEEDADDFGKLGRINRVKREKEEKSRKSMYHSSVK
jgi:hypothetical protein